VFFFYFAVQPMSSFAGIPKVNVIFFYDLHNFAARLFLFRGENAFITRMK